MHVYTPKYNYTITLHPYGDSPDRGVVRIDPQARYGYWEYKSGAEGGGLWFEPAKENPNVLSLYDYDGAYSLPPRVVGALRVAGISVHPFFDS